MAELCIMYPDGSIANVKHAELHYEQDKRMVRDIGEFMQMSQLGVCSNDGGATYFTPVSKMLSFEESIRDHAMAIRDLGKKVKALERGR